MRYHDAGMPDAVSRGQSYFDFSFCFNTLERKTLRAYSGPLKLSRFDGKNWTETDDDLEYIGDALRTLPYYELPNSEQVARLVEVEVALSKAGPTGWNFAGLNVPVAE